MANFVYATDASVRSDGLNFDFVGDFETFSGSSTFLLFSNDAENFANIAGSGFVFQTFLG